MHPLNLFRFCPKCGSNRFQESSPFSKKCADCGFEYFKNPVIGVAVAAFDTQDRLLCIRRGKEPAKGTLGLPGGFVDLGETLEQAAIREVREEIGIEIELTGLITNIPNSYIYAGMEQSPLDFYFTGRIQDDSQMRAQDFEISEVLFIHRSKINPDTFGLPSARIFLKKMLETD